MLSEDAEHSYHLPSCQTHPIYIYEKHIICTGMYIKRYNLGILINNWVALKMGKGVILFLY